MTDKKYRVSKKSVISGAGCKIVHFFATLLYGVFSIFLKIFNFVDIPIAQKNPQTFFLSKSKVQKCVYKLFLSKSKIL